MRRENSGLIDLDALLKEASQPELPKSADSSLEVSAPPPEPPPPAPACEPPPSPPHPVSSASPAEDSLRAITAAPPAKKRSSRKPWLALAVVPLGIAVVIGIERSPDAPAAVRAASQAPVETQSPAAAPNTPSGISLADLPVAVASSSAAPIASHVVHAAAPIPVAIASAKLTEIAESPQSANGDLGGAMRDAVGAKASAEIANVEAPSGEGARQLRPSPGAVVGAINSVMPAARMCLDGSEIVRNATIVFKSDGTVSRVDIAGAPNVADDCIRGALTNARMTPFLAETFAARATVRP